MRKAILGLAACCTIVALATAPSMAATLWPSNASKAAAAAAKKKSSAPKDALAACVAALGAGAYEAMEPSALAAYCVELVVALETADYSHP